MNAIVIIFFFSFSFYETVVIEKGEFDYMQPSAECYRRQMLKSVEKFGDGQFDHNNHTHVCFRKVHFVNNKYILYCKVNSSKS